MFTRTTDARALAAGASYQFTQTGALTGAKLWHPYSPHLYTLVSTILVDGIPVDEVTTKTGFRKIQFTNVTSTAKGQILINDSPFEGLGTNTHQEIGMVGFAVPEDAVRAEVRMIKDAGFDFIRSSHYPYQKAFYDACDEFGVMVQNPITGWQNFANNDTFKNNMYKEAMDLIRRDRNHPSVVLWELYPNESSSNNDFMSTMNTRARAEFPTKQMITTGGTNGSRASYDVTYVHSNNLGSISNNAPNIFYEYGDWQYGGDYSTTRIVREYPTEDWPRQAVANFQAALDRYQASRANFGYYWVWQDYSGFGSGDPISGAGGRTSTRATNCGIVDMYRLPKYAYYYAQSQRDPNLTFSGIEGVQSGPMVYIATRWFDTTSSARFDVPVYSNAERVELFADGVSQGVRTPDQKRPGDNGSGTARATSYALTTDYTATKHPPFTFTLADHSARTLRAVAYIGDEIVAEYTVATPADKAGLRLRFQSDTPLAADGGDARLVYVDLLDANGQIVTNDSATQVTLHVTGDAKILGGDTLGSQTATVRGGQVSVWLVAGHTASDITVSATSPGLPASNTLSIGSVAVPNYAVPEEEPDPGKNYGVAKGRPAGASSNNTTAGRANNGRDDDAWLATNGDAGQYWQVNLGRRIDISRIRILWGEARAYRYRILLSDDGTAWRNVVDRTEAASAEETVEYPFAPPKTGQYLRILFTEAAETPFSIAEVYVFGADASAVDETDLAFGKPSWSSAIAEGSVAAYGNDGDPNAFATMPDARAGHTWTVDLGGYCTVSTIDILWAQEFAYKFKLETSTDNRTWRTVLNKSRNVTAVQESVDVLPAPVDARYVRITSAQDTAPMSFSLFKVFGRPAADLALGKAVRTDSAALPGYKDFNANDGDSATVWQPDGPGRYLDIDLGDAFHVSGLKLVWADEGPHEYLLLSSPDGVDYYKYFEGTQTGLTDLRDLSLGRARYLRLIQRGASGVAAFEAYGWTSAAIDAAGGRNVLTNPSFESLRTDSPSSSRSNDFPGWQKLPVTTRNASYAEQRSSAADVHGAGNKRGTFWLDADYSASLVQTVQGLPDGLYDLEGWILHGQGDGDAPPLALYAYVENYGGETLVQDFLGDPGKYPDQGTSSNDWRPMTIQNIHVANGQLTLGFYGSMTASNFFNVDDLSLTLVAPDLPRSVYDPAAEGPVTGTVSLAKAGHTATASFAVRNEGAAPADVLGVLARYDAAGRLAEVQTEPLTVAAGAVAYGRLTADFAPDSAVRAFLWHAGALTPLADAAALIIIGLDDVAVETKRGDVPALPETVTARYSETDTEELPVVWDDYDPALLQEAGAFVVLGAVAETAIRARARVTVLTIVSIDDVVLTVNPGAPLTLPGAVTARYSETVTENRAVVWDAYDPALLTQPGSFSVYGAVEGTDLRARARVTVSSVNLVVNPGFESAGVWTFSTTEASRKTGTSDARTGSAAVNYYRSATGAGSHETYQTINDIPAGKYTLDCWIHGETSGSAGVLQLFIETGGTTTVQAITTSGWQNWQHPVVANVPITTGTARIGIRATTGGGSWYWYD
ncbi:MAG: discoidin domain-containing protein, partial [Oscillospiraceae bacterium]|nr:discoidin domain-containing protein [Oscillospiraceae bacterium]